ncbi:MAG: dihydroorotate dehydrogenase (quinone), partial [Patescibacteria group bacterium]
MKSSEKLSTMPSIIPKKLSLYFAILSFLGFVDASYLSIEHFLGKIPPCSIIKGCDIVTTSSYSVVAGVPIAFVGAIYYLIIFLCSIALIINPRALFNRIIKILIPIGFVTSLYLVYVQIAVLKAICLYCMFSATISLLFMLGLVSIINFKIIYKYILKPIFFLIRPETIHDIMTYFGSFLGKYSFFRTITRKLFDYKNVILEQTILGINFKNPIGLSAGFDKNAQLTDIIPFVGFGFIEVGSITGKPCVGNAKPRLWRLKELKGLIVYYGLKNNGSRAIANKLRNKTFAIPTGTSIAMTNCQENLNIENAIEDYAVAFKEFVSIGDYFTINISCPNAQGGQPFIDPIKLDNLLKKIDEINTKKPIFVKLSPDLSEKVVDDILLVLKKHRVHGIICTNLTKNKNGKGGISGKSVQNLSDNLLAYIYKKEKDSVTLIGCG